MVFSGLNLVTSGYDQLGESFECGTIHWAGNFSFHFSVFGSRIRQATEDK